MPCVYLALANLLVFIGVIVERLTVSLFQSFHTNCTGLAIKTRTREKPLERGKLHLPLFCYLAMVC